MKARLSIRLAFLLAVALALALAGAALAQTGGPYNLEWNSIDGGGATMSGGDYVVSASAGQPDAGPLMTGGDYTLQGGFWAASGDSTVFVPAVLRGG